MPYWMEWIQKMWYIYTMENYSAIRNNGFIQFLDKWMELDNIILSEVTQSQRTLMVCMHSLITDISLEAWNTHETIHISNDDQEEGRSGPWSWKGSVQQCRTIPG